MDIQVTYFDQKGPVNTEATLRIARKERQSWELSK